MDREAWKYRHALSNAVRATRKLLEATPDGHPDHDEAKNTHRAVLGAAARQAKRLGDTEYRDELLAEQRVLIFGEGGDDE
jgi:hypothetical protein